jgi:NADPH:quinone reductase-like Zn-dependent oxidoreductase
MYAWILDESPGSYRWGEMPDPEPGPDDVVVSVVASALNHMDLWLTRGMPKPTLPHIPGCDVAGVVHAIGSAVTNIAVGDEVVVNPGVSPVDEIIALGNDSPMGAGFGIWGEHDRGGHANLAIAPSRNIVARPAGRTWEECAAYPLCYLTAWRMLRRARLAAGDTLLVVGIGGGVATAALALGNAMGAHVAVTSRDGAKRDRALSLGAIAAFDSADSKWPIAADVVVETVGPATWDQSVRALKAGGRLVLCGGTSGPSVELNLPRLFFKQIEIIGSTMGSYQEFAEVTAMVANGLPVLVDEVYPLTDYPDALARLEDGSQLGKIVLSH